MLAFTVLLMLLQHQVGDCTKDILRSLPSGTTAWVFLFIKFYGTVTSPVYDKKYSNTVITRNINKHLWVGHLPWTR